MAYGDEYWVVYGDYSEAIPFYPRKHQEVISTLNLAIQPRPLQPNYLHCPALQDLGFMVQSLPD